MSNKPLIMAHRGASGIVGEDNTLLAYSRAIELECDMIELDVRRTLDSNLVCFHDDRVGDMMVATMTHPGVSDRAGLEVPMLEEVAALCHGQMRLNVELKELGYSHDVIDVLLKTYAIDDFILTSFRDKALTNAASTNPDVQTGLIVGKPSEDQTHEEVLAALPARLEACKARYLSIHHSYLNAPFFENPALRDYPVIAWTVDDPVRMRELLQWPLYAICTNRPDYLIEVMEREPKQLTREQATILAETENEEALIACLAGTKVEDILIPTRQIRIGPGVVSETGDWVRAFWGDGKKIAVVMDANTRKVAGDAVAAQLPAAQVVEMTPMEGWERLTPHDTLVDKILEATSDVDAYVSVGAGTVNDLTKYAAHRSKKPYISVATAPSMNGYAAPLAALVADGLKQPLPAVPPVAVIADTEILSAAPVDMIQSGYADLLARASCSADHRLASYMTEDTFDELPSKIVGKGIDLCVEDAEGIGAGSPEGVLTLTRALMLSSFSMIVAGTSTPASGGEHLISHYWDMKAYLDDKLPPAWHGFQVCLGTLIASKIYDAMRTLDPSILKKPVVESEEELEKIHGTLWQAIKPERAKPVLDPAKADERLERLRDQWQRIWLDIAPVLTDPDDLKQQYVRAGVPVTPEAHGISREYARHTLLHAHDIRARYSVLHFAHDAGILESIADEVLSIFD